MKTTDKIHRTSDNTPTYARSVESIEAIALDSVTGGCAGCGCGRPGAAGTPRPASTFRRV